MRGVGLALLPSFPQGGLTCIPALVSYPMRCAPLIEIFNLSISLKINSQNWNHQNSLLGIKKKILAFLSHYCGSAFPKTCARLCSLGAVGGFSALPAKWPCSADSPLLMMPENRLLFLLFTFIRLLIKQFSMF